MASLTEELRAAVGAANVLTARESCIAFESDGLTAYRHVPDVVVLPGDAAEVQAVMSICQRLRVPVVARGAGTGLSGGSLPVAGAVLLVLARLNQILELAPRRRLARVQPGVTNLSISKACAAHGLFYAPDPSSQIACSIGGNVAENSGGVHCLKYGITLHNILEIKVVTAAGELLVLGSEMGEAPGYALTALLTGSEGMLGVIVEVTVKLLPRPERVELVLGAFDDIGACARVVGEIISAGIIPAGLEMMDGAAICAADAFAKCGYPTAAQALLLCEIDGGDADVREQLERVMSVMQGAGAVYLRVAADASEQLRMWSGRKSAFPAVGRLAPDYYCMDGTIPRKHLGEMLRAIEEMEKKYTLRCMNVFHAGDGNLHPLILFDANEPGEWERADRFGADILELCVKLGGTITGEHGVGIEKINSMCVQFNDGEREAFFAVKRAFDEFGLLNPGKVIPTLHRCAEYGRMHVHNGELPFADLPRF
jgi:glycolate oxidase